MLWLFQNPDAAFLIVGDAEYREELDLRLLTVALNDPLQPRPAIEGFGVLKRLPLIDAAGTPRSLQMKCLLMSPFAVLKPGEIFSKCARQASWLIDGGRW